MDIKTYASILRLQSEHLQKLVMDLTARLVAFEQAVDSSDAITTLHLDGVEELSQNITVEVERIQDYIRQCPHLG